MLAKRAKVQTYMSTVGHGLRELIQFFCGKWPLSFSDDTILSQSQQPTPKNFLQKSLSLILTKFVKKHLKKILDLVVVIPKVTKITTIDTSGTR